MGSLRDGGTVLGSRVGGPGRCCAGCQLRVMPGLDCSKGSQQGGPFRLGPPPFWGGRAAAKTGNALQEGLQLQGATSWATGAVSTVGTGATWAAPPPVPCSAVPGAGPAAGAGAGPGLCLSFLPDLPLGLGGGGGGDLAEGEGDLPAGEGDLAAGDGETTRATASATGAKRRSISGAAALGAGGQTTGTAPAAGSVGTGTGRPAAPPFPTGAAAGTFGGSPE